MRCPAKYRIPFLLLANLLLLIGIWTGLQRLGWQLPFPNPRLPARHGLLMISGFLGTLISLERAAALKHAWSYLAPASIAIGSLMLIVAPQTGILPHLFIQSGGLVFIGISVIIIQKSANLPAYVIGGGVLLWFIGNLLWFGGMAIPQVVGFWGGFLVFVIAGERLELSRVLKITPPVRLLFGSFMIVILAGIVLAVFNLSWGNRLTGMGMILLSLWLLKNDLALKTLRHPGLYRYVSIALLIGYVWLGISGILSIAHSGAGAGPYYDAILHTLFIGFVFSMIFGHAPIIFPAILGVAIRFREVFYVHLTLLHLTLILRIVGDLTLWIPGRYWGGMLNGVAIVLFLVNTVASILSTRRIQPGENDKAPNFIA